MVEDCFSREFNLLTPCPNAQNEVGQNWEKYVPNPRHTSPRALEMFEFLGRIMGISMRHALFLPFEFPGLIWKQLVGQQAEVSSCFGARDLPVHGLMAALVALLLLPWQLQDVADIDLQAMQSLETFQNIPSKEAFEAKYENHVFTVMSADGRAVELLPGGFDMRVEWSNRHDYVRLAKRYKLHEFDLQVAALKRGLYSIVPERAVKLCNWEELEEFVCGSKEVDLALLKLHTTYHGYTEVRYTALPILSLEVIDVLPLPFK